jgi:hypothetical protein
VKRAWGQPAGGKATVEIIEHQGTPQEAIRRETLVIDDAQTITVNLAAGRRTQVADVPAIEVIRQFDRTFASKRDASNPLEQLKALASPVIVGIDGGLQGGVGLAGQSLGVQDRKVALEDDDDLAFDGNFSGLVNSGVGFSAHASIGPDGAIRVNMTPFFAQPAKSNVTFTNPAIPTAGSK